jgi:hypothetical protein
VLDPEEGCDDGNVVTEGCPYGAEACMVCAATCVAEPGAARVCGDGEVDPEEGCDDGNVVTEGCAYGAEACVVCAETRPGQQHGGRSSRRGDVGRL